MNKNIITQIIDMIKAAGIAPEIVSKVSGLMDGIDMQDIASILPQLQSLGLPKDLTDKISGLVGQNMMGSVMSNIPGMDSIKGMDVSKIGSMAGDIMNNKIGSVGDMTKGAMDTMSGSILKMEEVSKKSSGILGAIKGLFGM